MTHDQVRQALSDYLEGELEPGGLLAVERHLAACPECRLECAELRATVALLRGLPDPEPPPGFAARIVERLAASEEEPWLRRWARTLWRESGPFPLAAAAAGLVVLALVMPRSREAPPPIELRTWSAPSPVGTLAPEPLPPPPRTAAFDPSDVFGPPEPPRGIPLLPGLIQEVSRGEILSSPGAPSSNTFVTESPALAPRPGLGTCGEVALLTTATSSAAQRCRPWLDGMMNLALAQAPSFLAEMWALPEGEREAWTGLLVRYAQESGQARRVGSHLQASGDPFGRMLAGRFLASPPREELR